MPSTESRKPLIRFINALPLNLVMCRLLKNLFFLYSLLIFLNSCRTDHFSDKKIFRYNEFNGIPTLDPAFARNQAIMWPVHQLFSTLVEVDDSMRIKPLLAESWELSEDRKEILFFLRRDVKFHDDRCFKNGKGRGMNADDVVYSLKRITDPAVASPGAWIFNGKLDSLNGISALNDSVVRIKLLKPFQPIMGILTMQYCSIVPHEAVEYYGNDFRRHPVGTGPFRFVAWEEGQALVLRKNENYFEKDKDGKSLPYLDGIKISFLDSRASEFLQLQMGNLDFINDVDPSFKDEVLTKTGKLKREWEGKLALQKHPYLNVEYLGVLMDSTSDLLKGSALKQKLFRRTISYSINRKKMMLYLRNSIGTAAINGFIPPGLPAFDADKLKGYDFDPVEAKRLLNSIGYDQKKNPPIILATVPVYSNLATYVANDLEQVGISVKIETVQKSLLLQQMAKSQVAFFRGSWIADYPDEENYLSVFYGKNPAPPNYTRFSNPLFDRLYEAALTETDNGKRREMYQRMDSIIVAEMPVIPLWYDMAIHLVKPGIQNFNANSLNMLELRRVSK